MIEESSDDETVKASSRSRASRMSFQSTNTSLSNNNTTQMKIIKELQESVKNVRSILRKNDESNSKS